MKRIALVALAMMMGTAGVSALAVDSGSASSLVAEADTLFDRSTAPFDLALYEGRLREAIRLYEQALPLLDPTDVSLRARVLNTLAQAYFELATAYLTTNADKEAAFIAGKDHALASLRLDPAFCATEKKSFREALASATDVAAVFWYGNDFGSYLNYHQLEAMFGGGALDVPACYERAVELDETYLGGAPLRSLACYLARVPAFLGGTLTRARELFDRAIAIAPDFFENEVNLAELVLKPSGQTAEACALLREVVAQSADPSAMAGWPFYNELSVSAAQRLLGSFACP